MLCLCVIAGCAKTKPAAEEAEAAVATTNATNTVSFPILTPSTEKIGKVAMVNGSAGFVVLNFPIGEVAGRGQKLDVYRNEQKVGELKVTGPQRENTTAADIVSGDPLVDDEVRGN